MGKEPVFDDALSVVRFAAARRLPQDRYTSDDLIDLARARGYDFLSSQRLRDWVRYHVFPAARTKENVPGKQGRTGYWTRDDALLLLDLCALHAENVRSQALQLGSWLLGHPLVGGASPNSLLTRQIEHLEEGLYGKVLSSPLSHQDDETLDDIAAHRDKVISNSTLRDDLCFGLTRIPALNDADFADIPELSPNVDAGASMKELQHFSYFRHAGNPSLPPVAGDPGAALFLHYVAKLPLESMMTSEQLTELQHRLLEHWLTRQADLLPKLAQALRSADDETLQRGRDFAFQIVDRVLRECWLLQPPSERVLRQFLGERQDRRRAFAAPAFFPLTALLVAALILQEHQPRSTIIRRELLGVALDQLARLERSTTTRADAYLAVVFSVLPRQALLLEGPEEEVRIHR